MSQFLTPPPIPTSHPPLKVALVVGVRVHFGSQLRDLRGLRDAVRADADADVHVPTGSPGPSAARVVTEPRAEVLIDASGGRCDLFRRFGFTQARAAAAFASAPATRHRTPSAHSRRIASIIRLQELVFKSARAIGLVCHLHNGRSREESLRSRRDLAVATRSGWVTDDAHLRWSTSAHRHEHVYARQSVRATQPAPRGTGSVGRVYHSMRGWSCHHLYTAQENEIPEGNWASQFYGAKFTALRAAGVDLQNMVRPPAVARAVGAAIRCPRSTRAASARFAACIPPRARRVASGVLPFRWLVC